MRRLCAAALITALTSVPALAQAPALTTDWTPISLSQEECLYRAEAVMRQAGFQRIERIGQSIFADSDTRGDQITIRCIADRGIAFFVAAGGGGNDEVTRRLVAMVFDMFSKWR
jgi:hypothetical protein